MKIAIIGGGTDLIKEFLEQLPKESTDLVITTNDLESLSILSSEVILEEDKLLPQEYSFKDLELKWLLFLLNLATEYFKFFIFQIESVIYCQIRLRPKRPP